ncbi:hypothetical protein NQ317_003015 [Molorchus minor]|uniref:CCHC-type domain-containing protein n=1 Tax=Molorchus minor TaxID=1323400 RepID=A0ABQ9ISR4_9CUCU|nr:hypothetical protein NQ317_003015 [Molorchus minor]
MGIDVKQIRKTGGGDLLLVVKGGAEKADILREGIKVNVKEVQVQEKKVREKTLYIDGIDAATEGGEVLAAIQQATGVEEKEIALKSLKMGRFEQQMAVIEMPADGAWKLIRAGSLKIGWLSCKVKERIAVLRCFRCLGFGHKSVECKGTDRSRECLNCGQTGHVAKDCTGEAYCGKCEKKGHRADQTKCPHFKRLVEDKRRPADPSTPMELKQNIRILQGNLNRSRRAHDLISLTAAKNEVDIIAVCEPNKALVEDSRWVKDKRKNVAVFFPNRNVGVKGMASGDGFVKIHLGFGVLFCCYSSPNIALEEFQREVDEVMESSRRTGEEVLLLGDLNGKSPMWGSPIKDARGAYLEEWLAALDMVAHNTGDRPTFVRGMSSSFIDITCSTRGLARKVKNWEVMDEETLSDHRYICFDVRENTHKNRPRIKNEYVNDWGTFRATLKWRAEGIDEETVRTEDCVHWIKEAYDASVSRAGGTVRRTPYWWTEQIEELRSESIRARRHAGRLARRQDVSEEEKAAAKETYKRKKKDLGNSIRTAKRRQWEELCEELENDVWGDAYKIVTGRFTNTAPAELTETRRREIAEALFTTAKGNDAVRDDDKVAREDIVPFTEEELRVAAEGIKKRKAPGLDGIPPEAVIETVKDQPKLILGVLNGMLKRQEFPERWKVAKLVLIMKEGKPVESASAYRPICLIDTLAKLYERLIRNRLDKELEERGNLAANQYGFRKKRSTVQAVKEVRRLAREQESKWAALVTLDVRNAFNAAAWGGIIQALKDKGISRYLTNLWTKRLIPDVRRWAKCRHRRCDYYTTQGLTGHGSFKAYTKRIGKTEDEECIYCGAIDTVEHTLFQCERWERVRNESSRKMGLALSPENLVNEMINDQKQWIIGQEMIRRIMEEKEKEERASQERGRRRERE